MRSPVGVILLILMFCVQCFCTYGQVTPDTIYHIVKKSEDVYRISSLYNVPIDSIRRWNYLDRNYRVIEGMKLIIKHRKSANQNNTVGIKPRITDLRQKPKTPVVKIKPAVELSQNNKQTVKNKSTPKFENAIAGFPAHVVIPVPSDTISSKEELTSEKKGLTQLPDTSKYSEKVALKDSLQTSDRKVFLPIYSDPLVEVSKSTFFKKVLNFYFESGFLIKAIIFLNMLFLITSIILAIWLIYRRIWLGYIKFKQMKCQDRYRDFITDWLYEEHSTSVPESLIKELKDSVYRDVFTSELLSLHNNLTGESAEKLIELFHLAGFKKYSIQKVHRSFWHMKAKGFRELAQMRIKENFAIFKYLNSGNLTLSIEAQLAWIQLNPDDPLSFYDDPNVKLTQWGQLNLLLALKKSGRIPDFGRWLKSMSKSVSLFALKMAGNYKQFENVELITQRLDDDDQEIRREAICALGKMAIPSKAPVLQQLFPKEELENKTEIIRSLIMMSESSNAPFFEEVLLNETDINLRILSAKGLVSLGNTGNSRLNSLFLNADPMLKKIIIHAKDNRI